MSDTKEEAYHEQDELVSRDNSHHPTDPEIGVPTPATEPTPSKPIRRVNLILDPSAFTRGIGNIKRWYNEDYIKDRTKTIQDCTTIVNLQIPSTTLHQFDFLKKGTSMTATYARQSINFIDQLFDNDMTTKEVTPNFIIKMNIEAPHERGPPWKQCRRYQTHHPQVKEFPNFKTQFDYSTVGKKVEDYGRFSDQFNPDFDQFDHRQNDIQYENSQPHLEPATNAEAFAVMPARLKYLIGSTIHKKFIEENDFKDPLEQWKVITEDSITNVWVRSFGIHCMNVNEAELLMFQSYDVNNLYNPHSMFSLDDEVHHNSILQDTIDTSLYAYTKLEKSTGKKKPGQYQRGRRVRGVTDEIISEVNGETIKKERFDTINYAPRGRGELWKPPKK